MYKPVLTLCVILICSGTLAAAAASKAIPKNATMCPKVFNPPKVHCNLKLLNPIPVCQYLKNGKTRQTSNGGCDYMCARDVKAYRTGYCNGTAYKPKPITPTPVKPAPVKPPVASNSSQIPSNATICPANAVPPLVRCNLVLANPIPVCLYLKDGTSKQAYNTGCDYMCQPNVTAYINGNCNGSAVQPITPIGFYPGPAPILAPAPVQAPAPAPVAIPSNATVCPANHKPSLISCDVYLENPIPVCQYMNDGTTNQAFNYGCDDMCQVNVTAYINGYCNGSAPSDDPVGLAPVETAPPASASQIPSDATTCPAVYNAPKFRCQLVRANPIPVCQYLNDGTTNQAYDGGCDYMCQPNVIAYVNRYCNGTEYTETPIEFDSTSAQAPLQLN